MNGDLYFLELVAHAVDDTRKSKFTFVHKARRFVVIAGIPPVSQAAP